MHVPGSIAADVFFKQEAGGAGVGLTSVAVGYGGRGELAQGGRQRGKTSGGVDGVDVWGEKLGDVWAMQDCLSQVGVCDAAGSENCEQALRWRTLPPTVVRFDLCCSNSPVKLFHFCVHVIASIQLRVCAIA